VPASRSNGLEGWRVANHTYTEQEEAAMAVIRRWCDEGWTKGHVEVANELIHPNFKVHGAGGQVIEPGVEGLKQLILAWRTGFPDAVQRVDDIFALGDRVVVRLTWEGTHTGEFMGTPPSGKKVSVETIGIDRVVDGKVVEGWGQLDMLGLLTTIGAVVPATPVAEPAKS
jgi:predicted ester cyclase